MRDVAIVGAASTPFGRSQWSLLKLMAEASHAAMTQARLGDRRIDAVCVANMGSARNNRQAGLASALVDRLNLFPAAAETVENGPASGASAVKVGFQAVASGMSDLVLVCGGERMREVNNLEATEFVSYLSHRYAEYPYGVTLPALAGMFARLFMAKHGVTAEHLAMVAMKNHANALLNPNAHIKMELSLEGILHSPHALMNNPFVADPLRFFDCCPVSDGAAAVLLAPAEMTSDLTDRPVRIAGIGQATDTQAVHERPDPTELTAVRIASQRAFEMAGLEPKDISLAELHDAFTILEIAQSEEVGFFKRGKGHIALAKGETQIGGRLPINTSGGLKAKGHPVGATGVSQIAELVFQLRGEAGKRQVKDPRHGFALNFGGFGNSVVATILSRGF
ncbi:acetyl-CoA acetyltransferase [Candidatus Sumerlaeota bacterium]|nr:acetyl-CoA acetyltransferase [Candidatus Sumerlaeota bacterium]